MPPDNGWDDADLPGLDDASPEPEGVHDADLPGLEENHPSPESNAPTHETGPDWSDAELDEWFETDFGGDSGFNDFYFNDGGSQLDPKLHPDLHFGMTAYRRLAYDDSTESFDEQEPWRVLSHEAKRRFRRGWEDSQALTESVVGDLADYDAMKTLVDAGHELAPPKPVLPRWILVGGGFGVVGLVLVVGLILSGDDSDVGVVTIPTVAAAEQTTPPSTAASVADTEASSVAIDAPAVSVVAGITDPADYVTINDSSVLVDPDGDTWIEVTLAAPWLPGPPAAETAWSLIVRVGIDLGLQVHSAQWTLYDGATRGESHIDGDSLKAALDSDMWVTPEGHLVVKLPGVSATGGLAASDIGPGAELLLFGQLWLEEASELEQWEETSALGELNQVADPLPLSTWLEVKTDLGPITLVIPDTSDG